MAEAAYPFLLTDADEHSVPRQGAIAEYIDPAQRHHLEAQSRGRAPGMTPKNFQVTFSDDKLEEVGVHGIGSEDDTDRDVTSIIPGSLLNRLNPLKTLDAAGRKEFTRQYRALQPLLDNRDDRLTVMDDQGIEAAVNYVSGQSEYFLDHDIEALYALERAQNRYVAAEWGFNYQRRIFSPPFVSTVSVEHAIAELDALMAEDDPPKIIQLASGHSIGRSPFRPEMDPFWSRINEANMKICTHLAGVTPYAAWGKEWDEDEVMLGDMNAFQWVMYYGDRPAYELVAAAILQGFFATYPNIQLLLSEQGTVWVPYIVRKMDHAFLMGRRASFDRKLEMRPSEYFKKHIKVAPYPEENVERVIEAVGVNPITFGSDFPHGEGLPDPALYKAQLKNLDEGQVRRVMRDNLAEFLGIA
jgi:predicted TIM-barrel fold metal-dependent hydrolase